MSEICTQKGGAEHSTQATQHEEKTLCIDEWHMHKRGAEHSAQAPSQPEKKTMCNCAVTTGTRREEE
jgi:hypothetical protein